VAFKSFGLGHLNPRVVSGHNLDSTETEDEPLALVDDRRPVVGGVYPVAFEIFRFDGDVAEL
jgi:hypothetical protein